MADVSDPRIREAVQDVRDDHTDTDWVAFGYKDKNTIELKAKGSGGHAELMENLHDDEAYFCLLRMLDGDRESKRVKFIALTFVGEGVGGMKRARVGVHTGSIRPLLGQCNIDLSADNHRECTEAIIRKRLKVAGGADYDTGSNATGYKPSGDIRKKALEAYRAKEREGNIKSVVYVKSALPTVTPVDLGGRKMVAPPSEAKKNTRDSILDTKKFKGKGPAPVKQYKGVEYDTTVKKPVLSSKPKPAAAKPKPAADKPKPAADKPKPAVNKPKPAGAKPSLARKPSVGSKPATKEEPPKQKEEPAKQKEEPAKEENEPQEAKVPVAEPEAEEKPEANDAAATETDGGNAASWSMADGPIIEDEEERRRLRAEARRRRRQQEQQGQEPKQPDDDESAAKHKEPEQEQAQPAADERLEQKLAATKGDDKAGKTQTDKKKTSSIFEDDDGDDDLFGLSSKKAKKKDDKKKVDLFGDIEDDDDGLFGESDADNKAKTHADEPEETAEEDEEKETDEAAAEAGEAEADEEQAEEEEDFPATVSFKLLHAFVCQTTGQTLPYSLEDVLDTMQGSVN